MPAVREKAGCPYEAGQQHGDCREPSRGDHKEQHGKQKQGAGGKGVHFPEVIGGGKEAGNTVGDAVQHKREKAEAQRPEGKQLQEGIPAGHLHFPAAFFLFLQDTEQIDQGKRKGREQENGPVGCSCGPPCIAKGKDCIGRKAGRKQEDKNEK